MKKKSKCCNAKIDYEGGGYTDDGIAPIEEICTKCNQMVAVNGYRQKVINPKTGREIFGI